MAGWQNVTSLVIPLSFPAAPSPGPGDSGELPPVLVNVLAEAFCLSLQYNASSNCNTTVTVPGCSSGGAAANAATGASALPVATPSPCPASLATGLTITLVYAGPPAAAQELLSSISGATPFQGSRLANATASLLAAAAGAASSGAALTPGASGFAAGALAAQMASLVAAAAVGDTSLVTQAGVQAPTSPPASAASGSSSGLIIGAAAAGGALLLAVAVGLRVRQRRKGTSLMGKAPGSADGVTDFFSSPAALSERRVTRLMTTVNSQARLTNMFPGAAVNAGPNLAVALAKATEARRSGLMPSDSTRTLLADHRRSRVLSALHGSVSLPPDSAAALAASIAAVSGGSAEEAAAPSSRPTLERIPSKPRSMLAAMLPLPPTSPGSGTGAGPAPQGLAPLHIGAGVTVASRPPEPLRHPALRRMGSGALRGVDAAADAGANMESLPGATSFRMGAFFSHLVGSSDASPFSAAPAGPAGGWQAAPHATVAGLTAPSTVVGVNPGSTTGSGILSSVGPTRTAVDSAAMHMMAMPASSGAAATTTSNPLASSLASRVGFTNRAGLDRIGFSPALSSQRHNR